MPIAASAGTTMQLPGNGTLKTHPYPSHGLFATHPDLIDADLLDLSEAE